MIEFEKKRKKERRRVVNKFHGELLGGNVGERNEWEMQPPSFHSRPATKGLGRPTSSEISKKKEVGLGRLHSPSHLPVIDPNPLTSYLSAYFLQAFRQHERVDFIMDARVQRSDFSLSVFIETRDTGYLTSWERALQISPYSNSLLGG